MAMSGYDVPERLIKAERRKMQSLKKKSHNTENKQKRKEKALAEAAELFGSRKQISPSGGTETKDYYS